MLLLVVDLDLATRVVVHPHRMMDRMGVVMKESLLEAASNAAEEGSKSCQQEKQKTQSSNCNDAWKVLH